MTSPLNKKLEQVKWGEFKLGDLFDIRTTLSFDSNKLTEGDEYDYVTRTSYNQGILKKTGFVNHTNINEAGGWSLGLLQMDFFYRNRPWYAGQFVRNIVPKIQLTEPSILFFTTVLNKLKPKLLSVLVRHVDELFCKSKISLPITTDHKIDFEFINSFVAELEAERVVELEAYLTVTGLRDYELTEKEHIALDNFYNSDWGNFRYGEIFDQIVQGRRLKKEDQVPGDIPFVMAGVTNTGVVNYVSNPVAKFPRNAITVDIFGNVFYRNFEFGAGDDTGVYWSSEKNFSANTMLFFATCMACSLRNRFSYGEKLRSSKSHNFELTLPTHSCEIDFDTMETLISAVKKLVIRDVVEYANNKINSTKQAIAH